MDEIRLEFGYYFDDDTRIVSCHVVTDKDDPTGGMVGVAACNPKDNFCKNTGRKIALARAVKDYPKDVRTAVWDYYKNHYRYTVKSPRKVEGG